MAIVSGVPGSGKTYYTVRLIAQAVLSGKFVATNVVLSEDWCDRIVKGHIKGLSRRQRRKLAARWRSRVVYVESVEELDAIRLGTKGWEKRLEGRGVFVLDEAPEFLDSREWNVDKGGRKAAVRFFRVHRKRGWDGYLIAQDSEMVDKHVRALAEYVIVLRNLKRVRWMGIPLAPCNVFLALWRWHGMTGSRPMKKEVFLLSRRIAGLYDTHQTSFGGTGLDAGALHLPAEHDPAGPMLRVPAIPERETTALAGAVVSQALNGAGPPLGNDQG